jgi:lipopolysaccharide biosynthesis protein
MDQKITALIHMFYKNSYEELKLNILTLKKDQITIIFNIGSANDLTVLKKIATDFPKAIIIQSPNIGKDIGGKLSMIDLCLKLKIDTDYYIFIHDKKSPHTTLGEIWRNKLFKIIQTEQIPNIKNMFLKDRKIGIIGCKDFIISEYNNSTKEFETQNNHILKLLIKKYHLNINNYEFIGGTMFWIKASIIHSFFLKYPPNDIIASLEKGNVLDYAGGTQTHSWERMLCWIAIDQGYKIKGI